jgi:hypothetical protein
MIDDIACEKLKKTWSNLPTDLEEDSDDKDILNFFSTSTLKIIIELCNICESPNSIPQKIIKDVEKVLDKFQRNLSITYNMTNKLTRMKNEVINFSKYIINNTKINIIDNSKNFDKSIDKSKTMIKSLQLKFAQTIYQFLEKNK